MCRLSRVSAKVALTSVTVLCLLASPGLVGAGSGAPPSSAPSDVSLTEIKVLSNRADLISGGDALVQVVLPEGADPSKVRVDVDGRDVTSAFRVRPDGRFLGLVPGLVAGENLLTVHGSGASAEVTITNHPIGGPFFS